MGEILCIASNPFKQQAITLLVGMVKFHTPFFKNLIDNLEVTMSKKYSYMRLLSSCLFGFIASVADGQTTEKANTDWISVGGDRGCQRYSPLKQIDQTNVQTLEVAWRFHTGEVKNGVGRTIECTPLIVNGVMYITTAERIVHALDAKSGITLWSFDPLSADRTQGRLHRVV